jgi:molecular chaperone GrpE
MSEAQKPTETIIDNTQELPVSEDTLVNPEVINFPSVESTPSSQGNNQVEQKQDTIGQSEEPLVTETIENEQDLGASLDELELVINTLQQENAALKGKLEEQIKQTEQFKGQFVRNVADFENFRKRTEKEKEELDYQVKRKTLSELLSVIDNFERARNQIKPTTEGETTIHKSYQGVYRLLVDSLKRLGVSAMKPEGEPFDPNFHEAVMQLETNDYPEGTVIDQLQRGYLLGDRVLRHAMVRVATPLEDNSTSTQETSVGEQLETTEIANN